MCEDTKFEFETYNPSPVKSYAKRLCNDKPEAFNGRCLIRKYKVTIELIEEPDDILRERFLAVWDRRVLDRATHPSNIRAMLKVGESLGFTRKEMVTRKALRHESE